MTTLKLNGTTIPCKEYSNGLISAGVTSRETAQRICDCNNVAIADEDLFTGEIFFSELI